MHFSLLLLTDPDAHAAMGIFHTEEKDSKSAIISKGHTPEEHIIYVLLILHREMYDDACAKTAGTL